MGNLSCKFFDTFKKFPNRRIKLRVLNCLIFNTGSPHKISMFLVLTTSDEKQRERGDITLYSYTIENSSRTPALNYSSYLGFSIFFETFTIFIIFLHLNFKFMNSTSAFTHFHELFDKKVQQICEISFSFIIHKIFNTTKLFKKVQRKLWLNLNFLPEWTDVKNWTR